MTKPKFCTDKFIESALRFVVYFLMVAVTPLFGRWLAPVMDWLGYSLLRGLYAEIFTVMLWGVEALAVHEIAKRWKRKRAAAEKGEPLSSDGEEGAKKKEKREPAPLLPWKRVGLLTAICAACILLISAVIGFQVKPFYDMGEKFTGFEMWVTVGQTGRNAFKCVFIVYMLQASKSMAEEILSAYRSEKKDWQVWLITGGILLLYGLYDIFVSVLSYPLNARQVGIGLCYLLFYGVFTLVYYLTKESKGKAYCLIALIYIF